MITLSHINKENTLKYLAFGNHTPNENILSLINECELLVLTACNPKYTFRTFDIDCVQDNCVYIKLCKMILTGNDIVSHLQGCEKVILMCITIGADVDKLIRQMQISDITKAVIIDTMGSVAVEQVCDEVEKILHNEYSEYNMTWRFSAGYGDLPLDLQKDFIQILDTQKKVGVTLLDSLLMTPSKSVTAIIGLSKNEISNTKKGCAGCSLKETCAYRKRGTHCE